MNDVRLTKKAVALFFFPLVLNVQLMSVSHSIINAGLARLETAVVVLAGFYKAGFPTYLVATGLSALALLGTALVLLPRQLCFKLAVCAAATADTGRTTIAKYRKTGEAKQGFEFFINGQRDIAAKKLAY